MSTLTKGLILIGVILLMGIGLIFWKNTVGGHHRIVENISKEEMEMILADENPMMLRQIANDPEAKKEIGKNIEEMFALAAQAKADGLASDINVQRELENMEIEMMALNYGKEVNQDDNTSLPPLERIGEDRVNQFYEGNPPTFWNYLGFDPNSASGREAAFQRFLDSKIELMKKLGRNIPKEIPEDQLKQARDYFAKTRIYYNEALEKINAPKENEQEAERWANFARKVELQTKFQKAQFLASLYQQNLAEKVKITKEDIAKYLKENPEIDKEKVAKEQAEQVLQRIKNGEDFAALAKEFSEDPGSKEKGGLYEGITEGSFVPEFEQAVFSLQPGDVAPEPVKSKFGYHIIKLEKFGEKPGADGQPRRSFDARHILFSTTIKDLEDPSAREMPVEDFVRAKLEKEKQEKLLEEIKKNNPVQVATDFEIKVPEMPESPSLPPGMMPEDTGTESTTPQKPEAKK